MSAFRAFVILGTMRTGSNFLEATLSEFDGISCYGEVFNPAFIGKLNQTEFLGYTLDRRETDPLGLLDQLVAQSDGLPGFRLFNGHDPRVIAAVLADQSIAKIVLTRDLAECYVSLRHAQATGQWKASDLPRIKSAEVTIDREAYLDWRAEISDYFAGLTHSLRASGQSFFAIDYDELHDVALLNGLATWLGIEARIDKVSNATKKQIARPKSELITNWAEVADLFGNTSAPDQWHRASGPAINRYLAAEGVPLLYMPVRGGTSRDMSEWFGALGDVLRFNPKSLRDWRSATPAARTFTIVRHPMDRLIALYFADSRGELRDIMARRYKLRFVPDPGSEDLVAFARVVRASSSAQTSFRPPPEWAPQSDNLRDLAQNAAPDHVLRDEALEAELAALCDSLPVTPPTLPKRDDLSQWHSADLDREVRALWAKDYLNFGYGAEA
jgi:LPS sulfotransferase NodH